ncbi:hypothetical protein BJ170DRAFT_735893 [Xylariales sp. AK1849]|nr:hypothetical protein BJ170DRAFT_735893 [Xylariales sp. AK1849]
MSDILFRAELFMSHGPGLWRTGRSVINQETGCVGIYMSQRWGETVHDYSRYREDTLPKGSGWTHGGTCGCYRLHQEGDWTDDVPPELKTYADRMLKDGKIKDDTEYGVLNLKLFLGVNVPREMDFPGEDDGEGLAEEGDKDVKWRNEMIRGKDEESGETDVDADQRVEKSGMEKQDYLSSLQLAVWRTMKSMGKG